MSKYPIIFKAAVLEEHNKPLAIKDVEFEGPLLPGQVLVRIHYSGICGKQIEEIQGTKPDPFLPHLLGHEGSGVVVDTGPGVKKVVAGDHVVLHWMKGSGIDADTPIYKCEGRRVNAGWITTFNEYGVISENRITPIPKEADLSIACLLGCAVTTGVGVVLNEARLSPGDTVAVFGCGGVGLNIILGAVLIKASSIIAVDRCPEKLKLAVNLGATDIINSDTADVVEEIKKITSGKGVENVFIAAASPAIMETAVESTSAPGAVFFVAVPPPEAKISINALDIHRKKTLYGACGGGIIPEKHIPLYLNLYTKGLLPLDKIVADIVGLEQINDSIQSMCSGTPGRFIVRMCDNG